MRIFIITMDDPVQTHQFIKYILDRKKGQVVGLAVAEGDRLRIGKSRSKVAYVFSLLLIMGIRYFLINSAQTIWFKIKKKAHALGLAGNPSIVHYAEQLGIPTWRIQTPNSKRFQDELRKMNIDVIINQSQSIIKKGLLDIPRIGVINRHNALLPKNRGRLTPFWVLYKEEKETGVSIHFVTEGIDAGDIIIQKKIAVSPKETFNSLVRKNYQVAPIAIIEALDKLEQENMDFLPNTDEEATYNTVPTFKQALRFRMKMMKRAFGGGAPKNYLQQSTSKQ
ncbi:MAG: hypothetical protein KDD02_25780 [Phaeodactylibacter sp.]|nr:hypothetical protein [Phaeodactylibacter sp.]MCB9302701.1 hypothetical protein [Lewinellaceae bacterium]